MIWSIEAGIGDKNNSFVDFEIFVFYKPNDVFFHLHVISDWFSKKKKKKIHETNSALSVACHIQN